MWLTDCEKMFHVGENGRRQHVVTATAVSFSQTSNTASSVFPYLSASI